MDRPSTTKGTHSTVGSTRLHACDSCDYLLKVPQLGPGDTAKCTRCNAVIATYAGGAARRSLAFLLAALVLFACTLYYPFLGFSRSGQKREMTLFETGSELWDQGEPLLASVVMLFIVGAPLLVLLVEMLIAVAIIFHLQTRLLIPLGRTYYEVTHWSMVDVFVIGVLVSLFKMAQMASIELGVSFFAFIGFAGCLIVATSTLNNRLVWQAIKELQR